MIQDLLYTKPNSEAIVDVCIVGAGAAGIVLTIELARRGKRVLLLEGGGAEIEEASQEPYTSEIVGLPYTGVHIGRFRAKGGTTTRWGGQILELDEHDFAARPAIQDSGWPFPKSELSPYYERALKLEGLDHVARKDEDVWREIGLEQPRFEQFQSYLSRWCPEPNFAVLHRKALEEHPGISVWLHANAVEPLLEGERMTGLRCRTLTGSEAVFHAREFVFCMGGIESSRFFLQPRPYALPWNRSELLGQHFQDHIECNVAAVTPVQPKAFHRFFDNIFSRGLKYHPKLRLVPSVQEEKGTLNIAGTIIFVSDLDETLNRIKVTAKHLLRGRVGQINASDLVFATRNLSLLARQTAHYSLRHRVWNPDSAQVFLRAHCEQEPSSRSSITLSETRDSLGLFRARLDWKISELELATIREFALTAVRSLSAVRLDPDQDLLRGDPAFLSRCYDSYHHMGGMRMSITPERGVVDPDLRLYGLTNTYICSAAVFPSSGFSNPTHTLLALAVRLGDHLAR